MARKAQVNNEELIKLAREGNLDAEEKLLEWNTRLCYHIAQKFKNVSEVEDLASIGKIGLIKAYKTFDLSKKVKFATYASKLIANEILMFNRKNKRHQGVGSIHRAMSTDMDGNELTLEDVLPAPEPEFKNEDYDLLKYVLEEFSKKASERDNQVMKMIYFDNMKQREIADILGISQSYISRLEKGILLKLKKIAGIKGDNNMPKTKIGREGFKYIFENYGDRKYGDIARVLDVTYAAVANHNKKYKAGEYANINAELPTSIQDKLDKLQPRKTEESKAIKRTAKEIREQMPKSPIMETIEPIVLEEPQYAHNPFEEPDFTFKPKPIIQDAVDDFVKEMAAEREKAKNLIFSSTMQNLANSTDIATMLYGIYQLVQSMPSGTNTNLNISLEVTRE